MNKTLTTLFTLTAMAVLPLCVYAEDGQTPIYAPDTIITEPGSYVVTRDITAATGPVIDIEANDVTIDLNGYTIENLDAATAVVDASGFFDVFLTNGTLKGGSTGFLASNAAVKARVTLENLAIKGASSHGIDISTTASGSSMNVKASKVSNAGGNGINASTGPSATVDIVDNTVEDVTGGDGIAVTSTGSIYVGDNTLRDIAATGVSITGAQGAVIEDNQILNVGPDQVGISITKAAAAVVEWGNQIRGNTLSGSPVFSTSVGIYIGEGVKGNILSENVATLFGKGIQVESGNNIIQTNNIGGSHEIGILIVDAGGGEVNGNTIQQNNVGGSGFVGIEVGGTNNIVKENQCQGSPAGVNATIGPTNVNYIIDNMLGGNAGAVAGGTDPAGNVDGSGNLVN
jgi:parallel beta-helix repeat protein